MLCEYTKPCDDWSWCVPKSELPFSEPRPHAVAFFFYCGVLLHTESPGVRVSSFHRPGRPHLPARLAPHVRCLKDYSARLLLRLPGVWQDERGQASSDDAMPGELPRPCV
jgi:hypothetical protein